MNKQQFPHIVIKTPLGEMSQGNFLALVNWPPAKKKYFKRTWLEFPGLEVADIEKLYIADQKQLKKSPPKGTSSAKVTSQIKPAAKVTNNKKTAPENIEKVPKPVVAKLDRKGRDKQAALVSMASLDDTMTLDLKDFVKKGPRKRRPLRRQKIAQEGGDFLAIKCQSCSQLRKIICDNAGKQVKCRGCQQALKIPDAKFYLRHNLDSDILGPFSLSQQRQLVQQGKIELEMYISFDQVKWKTIEKAGRDFLKAIVHYSPDREKRLAALEEIDEQMFLYKLILHESDMKICRAAIQKIRDPKLLDRSIFYIKNDNILMPLALKNLAQPALIADHIADIAKYGLLSEILASNHQQLPAEIVPHLQLRIEQAKLLAMDDNELEILHKTVEELTKASER